MNLKNSAIMLSFAAAMALLNTTAFAIDMSRTEIIKTTGKVSVKKTTSPDFKKLNSNLKLAGSLKNLDGGDKVRTFNDSTADLALKDTCILMMKEQSIFEVPKVLTQSELKALKAQQGSLLFKVAKGNNFQVHTADVICGVKGTMFSVTILDNFQTALETTGLQLGYLSKGCTDIEVYEGEVEVTNKKTNQKINVLAKEKISVIPDEKDMTKAIFNPQAALKDKWGNDVHMLMNSKNIKELSDTYDKYEKLTGNRSGYQSKIYYDNKIVKNINKVSTTGLLGKNKNNITESDLKTAENALFSHKEKFHANEKFSRISRYESDKTFSNSSFGEVYLGHNTLAACKAANGETSLFTEPIDNHSIHNGMIMMGFGMVKINSYDDKLKETKGILVNVYQEGNEIKTVVRNNDKNLYWRRPDGSEPQEVPMGDNIYTYDMRTNKGTWKKAQTSDIPSELAEYNFSVIDTMQKEKEQLKKQNDQKQKEARKNLLKNDKVKKKLFK